MTDQDLLRQIDIAMGKLAKTGASKSSQGAENEYSQAYQACVRAGLKPALRKRYRY